MPVGSRLKHKPSEYSENDPNSQSEAVQQQQQNNQKHEFLKRRVKYDPRKAAKEGRLNKKNTVPS